MGNERITAIYGKTIFSEPNPHVVEVLEKLLERAKDGEILGLAAVALHRDGMADWSLSGNIGSFDAVGAIETMKLALISDFKG